MSDKVRAACPKCSGSGIETYVVHGTTEDSVEPIRCDDCDGFGRVETPHAPSGPAATAPMSDKALRDEAACEVCGRKDCGVQRFGKKAAALDAVEHYDRAYLRQKAIASGLADALEAVLRDLTQGAIPNDIGFIRAALRAAGRIK